MEARSGPVTVAIKVEEGALDCKDTEGEHSSDNGSFPMRQQIAHHHQKKKHQCRFCPFSSSRTSGVKDHERTHTGEKPFSCRICYRVFAMKGPVPRVIKVEEKAPGCEDAKGKHSSENDLFTAWQEIVPPHREKKYECRFCPFSCADTTGIKKHEMTHTGEKPFSCRVYHSVCTEV
ncbi:hypothetical protein HPB47_005123 [Ixodes persulcatus]|uniref:Uncharacterized protein n=1 Tax=Ixodes persulcatus TaxID=34615 RepID=A0AC60PER1_IXOPE|nr:hypothetical protein HPB47_005123 [Ixodes persulcatus]